VPGEPVAALAPVLERIDGVVEVAGERVTLHSHAWILTERRFCAHPVELLE
jgi:hypothetical protein